MAYFLGHLQKSILAKAINGYDYGVLVLQVLCTNIGEIESVLSFYATDS